MPKTKIPITISILVLSMLACNALIPPQLTNTPQPTLTMPPSIPTANISLPLTEEEVTRVSLEDAKAAFDSGSAIIVDVRSAAAYSNSHIPGAINIQLDEFEIHPTELDLPKDQWIITYCT